MSSESTLKTEANHTSTPPDETSPGQINANGIELVNHKTELEKLACCIRTETRRQLTLGSNDVYDQVLQQVETAMIEVVMQESNQNLTRAAQRLGLSRPTLRSKIRSRMPFE